MEKLCDNFNLNSNSGSEEIQPVKRGRGMPRQEHAAWRYKEDGTYDGRPLDPEYFKKYMIVKVPCPNCGVEVSRGHLSRHKTRKPCKLRTLQNLLSMLNMP